MALDTGGILLTDRTTPGTGTILNSAWWTAVLAKHNARPRCVVYHSTTQSLANATPAAILFNSEEFDDGGDAFTAGLLHSTSSNTSRITIPTGWGGTYWVSGKITFAPNAAGLRTARLMKNGVQFSTQVTHAAANGSYQQCVEISRAVQLAAGEYVELFGYQDSGGALNTGDAANRLVQNEFSAVMML